MGRVVEQQAASEFNARRTDHHPFQHSRGHLPPPPEHHILFAAILYNLQSLESLTTSLNKLVISPRLPIGSTHHVALGYAEYVQCPPQCAGLSSKLTHIPEDLLTYSMNRNWRGLLLRWYACSCEDLVTTLTERRGAVLLWWNTDVLRPGHVSCARTLNDLSLTDIYAGWPWAM